MKRATAPNGMTVYFSTYQSIDVVVRAQAAGLADFDLVICDEAHRTAGFALARGTESALLRVHDGNSLRADRRLHHDRDIQKLCKFGARSSS